MNSQLGDYFRIQCKMKMLTLGQVARLVGYRNVNKGVRKLRLFEQEGIIRLELLEKVVEALGMDRQLVAELAEEDRQQRLAAWNAWADEPVPMRLVVRLIAAVYSEKRIPDKIKTQEQAEAWACEFAAKHRLQVCLVVSRRLSVWIDGTGTVVKRTEARPDEPNEPYMWVGSRSRRFLMDFKTLGELPQQGERE